MIVRVGLALLFLLLLAFPRLPHLAGPIDDPHSWRQCDTYYYAWDYYTNGIDLLHPSVCWMGNYKTIILEFPLVEAILAIFWRMFSPDLALTRLIFFFLYAGSCAYLYLLVTTLFSPPTGVLAAVVYSIMPLGLYYSRAIHVDFAAVFFAHAMTYHAIQNTKEWNMKHAIAAVAFGALGFLIKAPYVFYFFFPLATLAWFASRYKGLFRISAIFFLPTVCFLLWRWHVDQVNSKAPDWTFIPGYIWFSENDSWYYGTLKQRLEAVS